MNKKMAMPAAMAAMALLLGGCGASSAETGTAPSSNQTVEAPSTETTAKPAAIESSFVDGVLTTPDLKVVITEHRIIPVGEPGNEYGSKPVIAFWYDITNISGEAMNPMTWVMVITAYQDNNPNSMNRIEIGGMPDERFVQTQLESIKQGGTVQSAFAYELDDLTTPVDLVASDDLGMTEIGTMTYNLQ